MRHANSNRAGGGTSCECFLKIPPLRACRRSEATCQIMCRHRSPPTRKRERCPAALQFLLQPVRVGESVIATRLILSEHRDSQIHFDARKYIQMFARLNIAAALVLSVIGLSSNSQFVLAQDSKAVLAAVKSGVENKQDFESVFDFVRSSNTEEKWREIEWVPSLWTGLQLADEKQKPVFVWAMNGDPLGCV